MVAGILDGGADLDRYVWIDVFAVRQWPSLSPDLDFASTIENCSSLLVVCGHLQEVETLSVADALSRNCMALSLEAMKKIAFLRVWCLAEISKAAIKKRMPIIIKGGRH